MSSVDYPALFQAAAEIFAVDGGPNGDHGSIVSNSGTESSGGTPDIERSGPSEEGARRLPDRARFALAGVFAASIGEWLQESCPNAFEVGGKIAMEV